jgi:hypothetical protein
MLKLKKCTFYSIKVTTKNRKGNRMKKFIFAIMVILLSFGTATSWEIPRTISHSVIETVKISADGTADLPPTGSRWVGWYITQVHVLATLDDAFTLTINAGEGGLIGTKDFTSGTDGDWLPLASGGAECRYITSTPVYTLSGLGSGEITLTVVLVQ